jgi:UDP-GlcNAc:undecaprenyl-phosphate GlcNAc-1-phosphate transferase
MQTFFLQTGITLPLFRLGILAFISAFVTAMLVMPPLIRAIHRHELLDIPDDRKEHSLPVPTMGGIASCAGLAAGCTLWFSFTRDAFTIAFFFSILVLFVVGILDDLRNMPARYKLVIQLAVAVLIAASGARITGFNGLFGIGELPVPAQYFLTILAITGITNAFNLIDGIDGLAGGLGFMSLVILGLFLTMEGEGNLALVAFSLSGGLLGFLYYNFNPARIFMGDTGSLVLGFVVSVLCVRLIQLNLGAAGPFYIPHAPVFTFSIVAIPVFDTVRVFALRTWQGRSPFAPDKTHIHHLLTNNGWSHSFAARLLCGFHALFLAVGYFLRSLPQWAGLLVLLLLLLAMTLLFARIRPPQPATAVVPADASV